MAYYAVVLMHAPRGKKRRTRRLLRSATHGTGQLNQSRVTNFLGTNWDRYLSYRSWSAMIVINQSYPFAVCFADERDNHVNTHT